MPDHESPNARALGESILRERAPFVNTLSSFRDNEDPEPVLLLANHDVLTRITAAWPQVRLHRAQVDSPVPLNRAEQWRWLWEHVRYSIADVAVVSGISERSASRFLPQLIANRLIYPDGTLHSFARRLLRDRVLKLFDQG